MSFFAEEGRWNGRKIAHCYESDPNEQMKCSGYCKCSDHEVREYCWYCYDAWGQVTDECFRPGVLAGGQN